MRTSSSKQIMAALAFGLLTTAATLQAGAATPGPLVLADAGQTRYVIVVGENASEAEQYAAKEMADFLEQVTGAAFPTAAFAPAAAVLHPETRIDAPALGVKLMKGCPALSAA